MENKKYSFDEVLNASKEYFDGDEMAATTWVKKYALQDDDGAYLEKTPDDMHKRMAKLFNGIEQKYIDKSSEEFMSEYGRKRERLSEEKIYELFKGFNEVIPAGSVMSGLGSHLPVSLSNCWVIDGPHDTLEDIFRVCNEQSQLMKRRGGVGFDISGLRPNGAVVKNSAKYSTGAASFMDLFSNVTSIISQCVEEKQELLTKNGLVKIKDIKIGDEVFTKKGFIRVVGKFDKGVKKIVSLKTKNGAELLATDDHVLMSAKSDVGPIKVKISELNVGDPLPFLHGSNEISDYAKLEYSYEKPIARFTKDGIGLPHNRYEEIDIPTTLDEKLAYLIGYAHGDGYTYKGKLLEVSVNNKDAEIIEKIKRYRKDVFGHDAGCSNGDGDCTIVHLCGTEGCKLLEENGTNKPKTEFLRVPEIIFNSPSSVQMSYLSGLFDADGYASGRKKGYSLCTINPMFAQDVRKLLLINGVFAKLHFELPKEENWKTKYYVNVVGKYNQTKFVAKMKESVKVQNKLFISKTDHILSPFIVGTEGIKKEPFIGYKKFISNQALVKCGMYGDAMMSLDYVESVSDAGEAHVYDIELESENMFWCNGFYVHNCGRRGALMLSINMKHPDALEFTEKKQDLTKVTGANVSVQIDDEFMQAAESDEDYFQIWPIGANVNVDKDAEYNKLCETTDVNGDRAYFRRIKAKEAWERVIHCAWNTAEPGILFQTRHHQYSPDGVYPTFRGTCTNPCIAGDVLIETDNGKMKIKDIVERVSNGESINVVTYNEIEKRSEYQPVVDGFLTKKNANIIEIECEDGSTLKLTPDHKVFTENRGWVEASKLSEKDVLLKVE